METNPLPCNCLLHFSVWRYSKQCTLWTERDTEDEIIFYHSNSYSRRYWSKMENSVAFEDKSCIYGKPALSTEWAVLQRGGTYSHVFKMLHLCSVIKQWALNPNCKGSKEDTNSNHTAACSSISKRIMFSKPSLNTNLTFDRAWSIKVVFK